MTHPDRRNFLRLGLGVSGLSLLAACSPAGLNFGPLTGQADGHGAGGTGTAGPLQPDRTYGSGPVRVAMLLPLSGGRELVNVGTSMANGAQLAMNYITQSGAIKDTITLVIKDTGPTAGAAAEAARDALSAGAKLILGPLQANQVEAAGALAKAAGIPLIGFSNNPEAASPGVYLLNVLPQVEIRRSFTYAQAHKSRAFGALFPTTPYGKAQQAAFVAVTGQLGITPRAAFSFSNLSQAGSIVGQIAPLLRSGEIDTLFLPDRASAPQVAALLSRASLLPGEFTIIGSVDWDDDKAIESSLFLNGAIYPAIDSTGYDALKPKYVAKFGTTPHPLVTIAYTAVVLANAPALSMARPPYKQSLLTLPAGFNGRDGVFKFTADGRSDYALVMKKVTAAGGQQIDGPKL